MSATLTVDLDAEILQQAEQEARARHTRLGSEQTFSTSRGRESIFHFFRWQQERSQSGVRSASFQRPERGQSIQD